MDTVLAGATTFKIRGCRSLSGGYDSGEAHRVDADKKAEEKCTCANAGLNQDEKMIPYECSKCDASFETLSEIDKHFASVHHEKNRDPLELNEELQQSKSPEKKVENSKDKKLFFIPIKKK